MSITKQSLTTALILVTVCSTPYAEEPSYTAKPVALQTTWKKLADTPPPHCRSEHESHGVIARKNQIFVLGGLAANGRPATEVHIYDVGTGRWQFGPPLPAALTHINAAVVGDTIYVVGGLFECCEHPYFTGSGRVFALPLGGERWQEKTPIPTGSERGGSGVGVLNERYIIVAGGHRRNANGIIEVADVSLYDVVADRWSSAKPLPRPLGHVAGAVVGNVFFAIGGRSPNRLDSVAVSSKVWAYDMGKDTWSERAPMPTRRTSHSAVAVDSGLIVVAGGGYSEKGGLETAKFVPETDIYDPVADQWRTADNIPTPRLGFGIAAIGNRVFAPGGLAKNVRVTCTFEVLEIGK